METRFSKLFSRNTHTKLPSKSHINRTKGIPTQAKKHQIQAVFGHADQAGWPWSKGAIGAGFSDVWDDGMGYEWGVL